MNTKPLGTTGVQIPEIGLGTWKYKGDADIVHRAMELGASLIDTAEMYETEEQVGRAIRGNREACFIATKVSAPHFHHKDVLHAADQSLMRLGVDTIDLYQLHSPNSRIPIAETMGAMDALVSAGKVRYVGVSNFSVAELRDAEAALGPGRVVSNQIKYSLFDHGFADELLPYCTERGITIIAYSSLEQGAFERETRRRSGLAEAIGRVCSETGKTAAQVLLRWVLHTPVAVTIPATNHVERINENCGASGWSLTDAQYALLTAAAGEKRSEMWWR
jgi:diketogulonate reductase-like aldo/keto reductase